MLSGVGIPAAVVGLHDQIRCEAVHLKARFLDGLRQTLVAVKILAAQIKLRRGGTPSGTMEIASNQMIALPPFASRR